MNISIFLRLAIVVSASLLVMACQQDNRDQEIADLHLEIDRIAQENQKLKEKFNQPLVPQKPTKPYNEEFLKRFCDFASEDVTYADILKLVKPQREFVKYYIDPLRRYAHSMKGCQFQKTVIYDHPFAIAEYKVDNGFVYVQAMFDRDVRVTRFNPAPSDRQMDIQSLQLPARDGVKMTTYVIRPTDLTGPVGTILMRTPYMSYGSSFNYMRLSSYYDKVLVIQANRGTHNSEGTFQWLHPVNMADGEDLVQWIRQQPFSNKKVVAYGVSYDGYNALATAANNPEGLVSVISCSSPAHAATDSFTSSQFVEKGIFGYMVDRTALNVTTSSDTWRAIDNRTPRDKRKDLDELLWGMDVMEWNEINEAIDDQNHKFWQERSLYEALSKVKIPIFHIAGLYGDQDGRDTILAFDHIQETSPYKNQHYQALHSQGHGCGAASRLDLWKKMIQLSDSEPEVDLSYEPKYNHFIKAQDRFVPTEDLSKLPIQEKAYTIDPTVVEDYYYNPSKMPSVQHLFHKTQEYQVKNQFVLNGAPMAKIQYIANVPEVAVSVYLYFIDSDNKALASGWRTGFITGEVGKVQEVELLFPLIMKTIPEDAKIQLSITTNNPSTFLRQPVSKDSFEVPAGEKPEVKILENSQFILPVENGPRPFQPGIIL